MFGKTSRLSGVGLQKLAELIAEKLRSELKMPREDFAEPDVVITETAAPADSTQKQDDSICEDSVLSGQTVRFLKGLNDD